ncbi:MAG: hypothetical protein C4519_10895 [Desulfobacteraceae bacterium]|nr:MAG: hypothetical protein C4519_10895 [Desulfobacteraceae bacterium]
MIGVLINETTISCFEKSGLLKVTAILNKVPSRLFFLQVFRGITHKQATGEGYPSKTGRHAENLSP